MLRQPQVCACTLSLWILHIVLLEPQEVGGFSTLPLSLSPICSDKLYGFELGARPKKKSAGNQKSRSNTKVKASGSGSKQKSASAKKPKQNAKSSAPPWQVLSKKEAKKNVEQEKERRKQVQEGVTSSSENIIKSTWDHRALSKTFLSDVDQKFLKWTRFNPGTSPVGMQFVGSCLGRRLPPRIGVPEIAFLGRSNVGKSSLLNRLSSSARKSANFNDQARVGKTPGATASVNLYTLMDAKENQILGWADLPGFGYAKLSKEVKESVQEAAEHYLGRRQELALGVLLVDIRRKPSDDDRAVLAALFDMGVPLVVVATKVDKVNANELEARLTEICEGLGLPEGQPLAVSSVTGEGTKYLWSIILDACETSVAEFKSKYESGRSSETIQGAFDDSDDLAYDQGYDWIHGTEDFYEEVDEEEEDSDVPMETESINEPMQRETLKSLRSRARDLERRGDL